MDVHPTLLEKLSSFLPNERIKSRLIDRLAFSSDAGFYRLIPQVIVQPANEEDVAKLFFISSELNIPITFRTGGTSLSGQSVSDGILIDLSQHWRKVSAEENGYKVRFQPGVIGSWVNYTLKKYGRKMGPDPSSIAAAMMGGILANNASGMCCGVKNNSYHSLETIRFVLPSGEIYDTSLKGDFQRFKSEQSHLTETLISLRINILNNTSLTEKIRTKYRMKNTVGYALNAFVDYEHPLDIFAHLLIGSEGTLAFIAEAVLNTLPDLPFKATSLFLFPTIADACNAIPLLIQLKAEAVELMDRASLRSVEHMDGMPGTLNTLPEEAAALLVEFQAENGEALRIQLLEARPALESIPVLFPIEFTHDIKQQGLLWKIRKGLFPAVGAVRQQGTTVILEDVAFPVGSLASAISDLKILFNKYRYNNAIIFGHAKDGNLHFVITQLLDNEIEIKRYQHFIEEMVELVVKKYDGSLKAEHGTGRNMAPFVETEWGSEAYTIMEEVKKAVDPNFLLNPGVVISQDNHIHLKNLKALPIVEEEVDKCIECGFCERMCPSRDITFTPRRRIVVRRLMSDPLLPYGKMEELARDFEYQGKDTCAADGLCATDCPVDINTGDLVKRLRKKRRTPLQKKTALFIARHFGKVETVAKMALALGSSINNVGRFQILTKITQRIRRTNQGSPVWMSSLEVASKSKLKTPITGKQKVVLYETCIQRMMGGNSKSKNWKDTLISLSYKSDIQLIISSTQSLCCGQAFSSKGFTEAAAHTSNESINWIWKKTEEGRYPVLMDTSSCAQTLSHSIALLNSENRLRLGKIKFLEVTEFCSDYLLPNLTIKRKKESVALHPVCSLEKMKLMDKLITTAKACAEEVIVPQHAGCCGMAGDKGFFFPELVEAATRLEADEVKQQNCVGHYSTGRTCELALSEHTGKDYVSLLYLLDEVSE